MKLLIFQNKKKFFFFLLLLTFFLRFSSLTHPFLDIDEAQFAGFAHTLMDGGLPYADSLDTKPPLIYIYFLIGFFIFGKYSMTGLHFIHILICFGVAFTLYKIAKENDSEESGLWAALLFTVFSTTYLPKFISISITSVMVLPLSLSVLFWMRNKATSYLFAGILAALAFLLKYQAGIQIVLFTFISLFILLRDKNLKPVKNLSFFYAGFLIPLLVTAGLLSHLGVLDDFMRWSFQGSGLYIKSGFETISFFSNLITKAGLFVLSTFLLWIGFFFYIKKKLKKASVYHRLLAGWFFLSLIPVCMGGRFYGHYFIQLLPSLCLGTANFLAEKISQKKFPSLKMTATFILIPTLIFWIPRLNQNYTYRLVGDNELEKEEKIGDWLKNKPGESIFVWGFATAIYFHSQKKPVSRFLWTDLQTGRIPGSDMANQPWFDTSTFSRKEAWEALLADLEKTPPVYFVDTAPADIHSYKKYPIALYPALFKFLMERYEYFSTVENAVIYKLKR